MSYVSRDILSGQGNGFALLGFERVLSALGLNAALQFALSVVLVLISGVLVGLGSWRIGVWLVHAAWLLLTRLLHAGGRVLGPLASAGRHLRSGRSHEK